MVQLYKVLYEEIEQYANIRNLNNFLENNEQLIYNCEKCRCNFRVISPLNIIMYQLEFFDNNILHKEHEAIKLEIQDFLLLSSMNLRMCRYRRVHTVTCGMCSITINKQTSNFNYCDYGLCSYITEKHYNFIKLNNGFFSQDFITDSCAVIKRYNYKFDLNEEILSIYSIYLDNQRNIVKELITKKSFIPMKRILEDTFRIDLFYLDKFLKEKCN